MLWEYQQFKESLEISWAVYNRRAAWMLTHKLKAKQKQKKKNDHVEHQRLPARPRDQHSESCFRPANDSQRTTSTSRTRVWNWSRGQMVAVDKLSDSNRNVHRMLLVNQTQTISIHEMFLKFKNINIFIPRWRRCNWTCGMAPPAMQGSCFNDCDHMCSADSSGWGCSVKC